ncbi:MAG: hypothetical protein AAGJ46_04915 [Planctomycetota bacterium]
MAVLVAPMRWMGGFYVASVVISLVTLAAVLRGVWKERTIGPTLSCGLPVLASIVSPFVTTVFVFISPVAMWHAGLTAFVLILTHNVRENTARRALACCGVMAATYLVLGGLAWQRSIEIARLRDEYPIVSVAHRLPPPAPPVDEIALAPEVDAALKKVERYRPYYNTRVRSLRALHQWSTGRFVSAAGFGVSRMSSGFYEYALVPNEATSSLPTLALDMRSTLDESMRHNHRDVYERYFDTDRLGWVEDASHVAGFASHALRSPTRLYHPNPSSRYWQVTRLELIGVLRDPEPVVYLLPGAPIMDQIANAETRPLDDFEAASLEKLQAQSDLEYEIPAEGGLRMVGAIRAAGDCLKCHQAKRGQLLGAFSYDLREILPPATGQSPP